MIIETELTDEDLKVLAHVVADPVAWVKASYTSVGPRAIMEKIEKYRSDYLAAVAQQGANYKNRKERDSVETEELRARLIAADEARAALAAEEEANRKEAFDKSVKEAVEQVLRERQAG